MSEHALKPKSPAKPYWVNAAPWTDKVVDEAALSLIKRIGRPLSSLTGRERQDLRELIFNVAMSSLPEASPSYFWPDLHREITRRLPNGVRRPTEVELTKFGRELLEATDGAALRKIRSQGIHHCFVALVIEQAGIGRGRDRIIQDFLTWLVDKRLEIEDGEDPNWSSSAVRRFASIQQESHAKDIALLTPVLSRIGTELIALVKAIEARANRTEVLDWNWSKLREWWIEASGVDLDALTPSAATVLHGWLSDLSRVWTRQEIHRLSKLGRVECTWPDGSMASTIARPSEIPLGMASLKTGERAQSILVMDAPTHRLADIIALDQDQWHSLDETYLCTTSAHSFTASHPDIGSISSVPVFVSDRDVNPGLHFAGSKAANARPTTSSAIRVPTRFKWRFGKLFVILGPPRTSMDNGPGYQVMAGDHAVWTGQVLDGHLRDWVSKPIDVARITAGGATEFPVTLLRSGCIVASQMVVLSPRRSTAFIVSGTSIYTKPSSVVRWTEAGTAAWRTLLLVETVETDISLTGTYELSRTEIDFAGRKFLEIQLGFVTRGKAQVRVGTRTWTIENRNVPRIKYGQEQEVVRGAVAFVGSGNIRVIENEESAFIDYDGAADEIDWGLWIRSQDVETFCTSVEVASVCEGGRISIHDLASKKGISIQLGLTTATLGTPDVPGQISFNFYLPPHTPRVSTSRIDQHSLVDLDAPGQPCWTRSDSVVTTADISESKYCRSVLKGDQWAVGARWRPVVVDLTLGDQVGSRSEYRYRLLARDVIHSTLRFRAICTEPSSVEVFLLADDTKKLVDESTDLIALIRSEMRRNRVTETRLVGRFDDSTVEWLIDASPSVLRVEGRLVSEAGGLVQVEIDMSVASILPTELTISVEQEEHEEILKSFWTTPNDGLAERANHMFQIARQPDDTARIRIRVVSGTNEIHRSEIAVFLPAKDPVVQDSLQAMICGYRETGSTAYLAELLLTYVLNFDLLRKEFPAPTLISKVSTGVNPESEASVLVSLKVLTNLSSGSPVYVPLFTSRGVTTALSAINASLWLFLANRYAVAGNLRIEEFTSAVHIVDEALSSTDHRIAEMAKIAILFARHVEHAQGLPPKICWRAMANRTSELDANTAESVRQLSPDISLWLKDAR